MLSVLLASTLAASAPAEPAVDRGCNLASLEANLAQAPEVDFPPAKGAILQSPDDNLFVSTERRVPCAEYQLLKLGFEVQASWRAGPTDSTNGAFEEMTLYQRGPLSVRCYSEFSLSNAGPMSKVYWTRYACQQIVPPRLRPK